MLLKLDSGGAFVQAKGRTCLCLSAVSNSALLPALAAPQNVLLQGSFHTSLSMYISSVRRDTMCGVLGGGGYCAVLLSRPGCFCVYLCAV